ncbi:MAG: winged helix-turn-helix domain-containing protein [Bilophila sp.]
MKLLHLYQQEAQERPGSAKYVLVADAIARGVAEGALAPGESLPTHRDLAETLGVTVGTVSRGYAEAAQRGLTVGVTGRGAFVAAPCHDVDVYQGVGRMHDLGFILPRASQPGFQRGRGRAFAQRGPAGPGPLPAAARPLAPSGGGRALGRSLGLRVPRIICSSARGRNAPC